MISTRTALVCCAIVLAGCGSSLTLPDDADLSGLWETPQFDYVGQTQTASAYLQFTVAPASDEITSIKLCGAFGCANLGADIFSGIIPITGGSFSFTANFPPSDCGTGSHVEITGTFKSETKAEGTWKDTNYGPIGYVFCGSITHTWKATK